MIDEEWEQVAWGACQSDSYLKARAFSVLELLNLIRDKFKDNLEDEIQNAMNFASITSVDDDIETKQAVQKVGNKTIYDGIATKLSQLKEEGYSEEAIRNYQLLWEPLFNTLNENSKFGISLAKTGASFNDKSKPGKGNQQFLYSNNPSKKFQAMKFCIRNNVPNIKAVYEQLASSYGLQENSNMYLDKKDGVYCEPELYVDLGSRYPNFIQDVINIITK